MRRAFPRWLPVLGLVSLIGGLVPLSAQQPKSKSASPPFGYKIRGTVGNLKVDLTVTLVPANELDAETSAPEPAEKPKRASSTPRATGGAAGITEPISFETPAADAILEKLSVFPADNPWNLDISEWPVSPDSTPIIQSIGADKPLRCNMDMAFVLVPPDQKRVPVKIVDYPGESDPGPFPVPDNVPIEGWPAFYQRQEPPSNLSLTDIQNNKLKDEGDRHGIVVDPVGGKLYEFYQLQRTADGWQAAQTSIFDLKSNAMRPEEWTSTDAAGLPIFPAVVRFDELERGVINHALRVTVRRSRRAYVYPARHFASRLTDANLPRMGERIRLKASVALDDFTPNVRTILAALQKHGMFVADNGIEWAISCAPDPRIAQMDEELRKLKGSDFEVVQPPADWRIPE